MSTVTKSFLPMAEAGMVARTVGSMVGAGADLPVKCSAHGEVTAWMVRSLMGAERMM